MAGRGADRVFGRGGNDLICGGPGNDRLVGQGGLDKLIGGVGSDTLFGGLGPDRLFGGPGPDKIAGQLGNDAIDGGAGVDTCFQNAGSGPVVRCERPLVAPPPGPAAILVIAYTDLNGSRSFDSGDVMISQIVDTNRDGVPSPGDTVEMGRHPLTVVPQQLADFAEWRVRSHTIATVGFDDLISLSVTTTSAPVTRHYWGEKIEGNLLSSDEYNESNALYVSQIYDPDPNNASNLDVVRLDERSPSRPVITTESRAPGGGDDRIIDVERRY